MMKKVKIFLILLTTLLWLTGTTVEACRFWVANTKEIPSELITEQLLDLPQSLKFLGEEYSDGWSVSFYKGSTSLVSRSAKPSHDDIKFDEAVEYVSNTKPNIVIGHLRRASSGCREGVPNPHPFQRFKDGKNWLFGHNGGMKKELLIELIGEEYLKENPPLTCTEEAPDSWVDSELYFIFLLKHIEEAKGHIRNGLKSALNELYERIDNDHQYFNFFLTDGKDVWAFRKGTSLFYTYDRKKRLSIVSSTIPGEDQFEWEEFPEDTLAVLKPRKKPKFIFA